jgi:hypothetical protein
MIMISVLYFLTCRVLNWYWRNSTYVRETQGNSICLPNSWLEFWVNSKSRATGPPNTRFLCSHLSWNKCWDGFQIPTECFLHISGNLHLSVCMPWSYLFKLSLIPTPLTWSHDFANKSFISYKSSQDFRARVNEQTFSVTFMLVNVAHALDNFHDLNPRTSCRLDGASSVFHSVNVHLFVIEFIRIWRQFIHSSIPCLHCSLMTDYFTMIIYVTSSDTTFTDVRYYHYPEPVPSISIIITYFPGLWLLMLSFLLLDLWNYHFQEISNQTSVCTSPFLYKGSVTPYFILTTWQIYVLTFRYLTTMFNVHGLV